MSRPAPRRGGRDGGAGRDGGGDRSGDGSILRNFVDHLRSGIDRFGDHRVEVRVDGPGAGGQDLAGLPVTSVECNHASERVCLRTPGLLAAAGGDGDGTAGPSLLLRDLLNQLSTAVAQGPEYALALADGEEPPADSKAAASAGRLELSIDGLQIKARPAHRALAFVVTVAG